MSFLSCSLSSKCSSTWAKNTGRCTDALSSCSVTSTQIPPPLLGLFHLVVLITSGGLVRVRTSTSVPENRSTGEKT